MSKVEDSISLSDVTVNGLTYRQATLEEARQICRMNGTTYQEGTLAQYKYLDKEFDYIAFREKPIFDEIFQAPVKKGFESRSQNADNFHEPTPTKLDIENMSPQQVLEYEQRIDEETRKWNSEIRTDAQGNQLI